MELAGGMPVLTLDMCEHSYHIDFGAKAATVARLPSGPRAGAGIETAEQTISISAA